MENWEQLSKKSPIDLKELKEYSRRFIRLSYIKTIRDLDRIKESLLEARGELEKMITLVLNYIKKDEIQLNEKVTDIIYEEFTINFSGFMKQIDDQQDDLFVKVGEGDMNISRLISFKIFLETAFFDIIFLPLKLAIEKYGKKKDITEFYYEWFMKVSCTLKVKAGLRREKSRLYKGKGQYLPYQIVVSESKKAKEGKQNVIDDEFKERFPGEFPEIEQDLEVGEESEDEEDEDME